MLLEEECVYSSEAWLHHSPGVPACEVVWSWVRIQIASRFLWAPKATLTSAWQGFMVVAALLSFQTGSWYRRSSALFPSYFDAFSEANGCFIVRPVDDAAVDERCYSIYLLSRLSLLRTEDIRPEDWSEKSHCKIQKTW